MKYNENTRVKISARVYLHDLDTTIFLSKKEMASLMGTKIFTSLPFIVLLIKSMMKKLVGMKQIVLLVKSKSLVQALV